MKNTQFISIIVLILLGIGSTHYILSKIPEKVSEKVVKNILEIENKKNNLEKNEQKIGKKEEKRENKKNINNKQENIKMQKKEITNNFSQIFIKEFKKELENPEITLIDVRTPGELPVYGKIREKQLLIDINNPNFKEKIEALDKTKKYLIYCWHGNRSRVARDYMKSQGFSYVKDLKGGIDAWSFTGEKVIK